MAAPAAAARVFGDRLPLAERYVAALASSGIERGLIGPREADRLWERHLLNCAVVSELLPRGSSVVDAGSGAGLPGVPIAIARLDVTVELIEPLLRRTTWLSDTVLDLGMAAQVTVTRGKVAAIGPRSVDAVTARAVAPLERLVPMCLPLVRPGGALLALKGSRVHQEISGVHSRLASWGAESVDVTRCGGGVLAEEATVVVVRRRRS